jgi:hypothetical protein
LLKPNIKGKFKEQLEKQKKNDTNDSWLLIASNGDPEKMKYHI